MRRVVIGQGYYGKLVLGLCGINMLTNFDQVSDDYPNGDHHWQCHSPMDVTFHATVQWGSY